CRNCLLGRKTVRESFMPLRLSAFLELLVVLLAAASQSYAQTYPKSPLQPTMQDCNALFHAYFYNIITPLNERIDQCMSTPARIDYVNRCDGGGRFLEAWPQCHQLHCQWNEAERQRSEQMRICQARALANQDRQRKLDQENEALRKIRDSVDTYDKLKNTYDQATSFVRDPFGYLQKALGQKIYDSIFPKDSPRPQLVGKAEDIFRFTFAAARKGLKEANKYRSPVIGAIQEEALRRVED